MRASTRIDRVTRMSANTLETTVPAAAVVRATPTAAGSVVAAVSATRRRRLTKAFVIATWAVSVTVLLATGGLDLHAEPGSRTSLSSLHVLFWAPFVAGALVSLLALPVRSRLAGPAIAGLGLGIDALVLSLMGLLTLTSWLVS